MRWFAALFGSTATAASAVFAAYFLGLALGSRAAGARAHRLARPALAYALLEATALLGALLVPLLLRLWDPLYATLYAHLGGSRPALVACKLVLALATLLPACAALGGTLPVVARALEVGRSPRAAARRANRAYALNTLGGAVGVGLAAFVLPERIGIRGTYAAAAALQLGVVACAALLGRRLIVAPVAPSAPSAPPAPRLAPARGEAWAAAAAGAGALAAQVVLLRALDQVMVSSLFNAGIVLAASLVAIGVAALVASSRSLVERVPPAALALAAGGGLALFPLLFVGDLGDLAHGAALATHRQAVAAAACTAAWLGLPLLALASMLLPWIVARPAARREAADVAARVGGLLAWNIAGSIVGSLATGFLLLGALGLWGTATLVALAYLAVGVAATARRAPAAGVLLGALALALVLAAQPWGQTRVWLGSEETLVYQRDGSRASVAVVDDPSGRVMRIDNHYVLAGTGMWEHEERRGHLPLLLHPEPRRVAVLGSATGLTAGAALLHPEVEQLDLVEIVPEVAEAARRFFGPWNRRVYDAPQTRVVVEDARNHMRASPARYDVVIGELFVPWNPGAAGLFTREHFEAVRGHLARGGLYCQWLPLYQLGRATFETVVATFRDVFPAGSLWRGSFLADTPTAALCSSDTPPDAARLRARMTTLRDAGVADRWVLHPAGFRALRLGPLGALPLGNARRSDEDRPWVELAAYRDASEPLVAGAWAAWTARIDAEPAGQVLYEYEWARLEHRERDIQRLASRARALLPADLFAWSR